MNPIMTLKCDGCIELRYILPNARCVSKHDLFSFVSTRSSVRFHFYRLNSVATALTSGVTVRFKGIRVKHFCNDLVEKAALWILVPLLKRLAYGTRRASHSNTNCV